MSDVQGVSCADVLITVIEVDDGAGAQMAVEADVEEVLDLLTELRLAG